jgi:hypothetical protein
MSEETDALTLYIALNPVFINVNDKVNGDPAPGGFGDIIMLEITTWDGETTLNARLPCMDPGPALVSYVSE